MARTQCPCHFSQSLRVQQVAPTSLCKGGKKVYLIPKSPKITSFSKRRGLAALSTVYYSVKPDFTRDTRPSTAASSSEPSAMIRISVPPIIPSERTPKRLFALTLLSSFSTQIYDLNSFAF